MNVNQTTFRNDFGDSRSLEDLLRRVGEQQMPTLKRRRSLLRYVDAEMERHHRIRTAVSSFVTVALLMAAAIGIHSELGPQITSSTSTMQASSGSSTGFDLKVGDSVMTCSYEGVGTWEHVDTVSRQRHELAHRMSKS